MCRSHATITRLKLLLIVNYTDRYKYFSDNKFTSIQIFPFRINSKILTETGLGRKIKFIINSMENFFRLPVFYKANEVEFSDIVTNFLGIKNFELTIVQPTYLQLVLNSL